MLTTNNDGVDLTSSCLNNFNYIPNELKLHITSYLNFESFEAMLKVNTAFKAVLTLQLKFKCELLGRLQPDQFIDLKDSFMMFAGQTRMLEAIRKKDQKSIKELLHKGAVLTNSHVIEALLLNNSYSPSEHSKLLNAQKNLFNLCINNERINNLLEQGADLNGRNDDGHTLWEFLAKWQRFNELANIFGHGYKNETQATTVIETQINDQILTFLEMFETDSYLNYKINLADKIEIIASQQLLIEALKGDKLMLKKLLHLGTTFTEAHFEFVSRGCKNILRYQTNLNNQFLDSYDLKDVEQLLRIGAQINAKDSDGNTKLHKSALLGNVVMAHYIIDAGADVNVLNYQGCTPLHCVVKSNDPLMAKILIRAGVSINAQDIHGDTALNYAIKSKKLNVAKALRPLIAVCDTTNASYYDNRDLGLIKCIGIWNQLK